MSKQISRTQKRFWDLLKHCEKLKKPTFSQRLGNWKINPEIQTTNTKHSIKHSLKDKQSQKFVSKCKSWRKNCIKSDNKCKIKVIIMIQNE